MNSLEKPACPVCGTPNMDQNALGWRCWQERCAGKLAFRPGDHEFAPRMANLRGAIRRIDDQVEELERRRDELQAELSRMNAAKIMEDATAAAISL